MGFFHYIEPSLKAWLAVGTAWLVNFLAQIASVDIQGLTEIAHFMKEFLAGVSFLAATIFTIIQIIKFLKKKKE